jgi:hypothetical protein
MTCVSCGPSLPISHSTHVSICHWPAGVPTCAMIGRESAIKITEINSDIFIHVSRGESYLAGLSSFSTTYANQIHTDPTAINISVIQYVFIIRVYPRADRWIRYNQRNSLKQTPRHPTPFHVKPMKKTAEQEVKLKLAIRDLIVRNPLVSGHQLCRDLATKGFLDRERQSPRLVLRREARLQAEPRRSARSRHPEDWRTPRHHEGALPGHHRKTVAHHRLQVGIP